MEFQHVVYHDAEEAIMFLYGPIGSQFGLSGAQFAREIYALQQMGLRKIDIHINSPGGSVHEGNMIYSAIVESSIIVHTRITGMAASMAGLIAIAGKKVRMADNALFMLHNPSDDQNRTLEENHLLRIIKDSLVTMFQNKTGLSRAEIGQMMNVTSWLGPYEALEKKLVDSIYRNAARVQVDAGAMSVQDLFNVYNNALKNDTLKVEVTENIEQAPVEETTETVETEENQTETTETAENQETVETEEQPAGDNVDTATNKKTVEYTLKLNAEQLTNFTNQIEALTNQVTELQNQVNTYKAAEQKAIEDAKNAKALELVQNAIAAGKIKADAKQNWMNSALANYDNAKNMLDSITVVKKAPEILNKAAAAANANKYAGLNIRELEKQDPKEYIRLKNEEPEKFEAMYNEYYKK